MGEEQALAAEQNIAEAAHHLDVEPDAGSLDADMADMDEQHVIGPEVLFDDLAGEIEPDGAGPRHLLQDEALATEEAGTEALLEREFQRHRFLGAEKRLLAADQAFASRQSAGDDGAGKTRREGDMAFSFGGEIGDEETAAAQATLQTGEKAAASMRIHPDTIIHPGNRMGLAVNSFARVKIDFPRLHGGAVQLVLHVASLSRCGRDLARPAGRFHRPRFAADVMPRAGRPCRSCHRWLHAW